MAHDSYEEDIELANGHPVGSSRNTPNMAERTLLHVSKERDKYAQELDVALSLIGELMSYDNFEAYPPYVQSRIKGFMELFNSEDV